MATIKYVNLGVQDLKLQKILTAKKPYYELEIQGYPEKVIATDRFFDSIKSVFKISESLFELWSVEEVLNRVFLLHPDKQIRVAVEEKDGVTRVLGGSDKLGGMTFENVAKRLLESNCHFQMYQDGVIYAHVPMAYEHPDLASVRTGFDSNMTAVLYVEIPVDGHGKPRIVAGMRLGDICICPTIKYFTLPQDRAKQFIMSKAPIARMVEFKDQAAAAVDRRDEEGVRKAVFAQSQFVTLAHRLSVASRSAASLQSILKLSEFLEEAGISDNQAVADSVGGNPLELYHLTSYNQVAPAKRIRMPVRCSVLDVILKVNEIAAYTKNAKTLKAANRFVGGLLADEFDFESVSFDEILNMTDTQNVIVVNFGGR